RYCTTADGDHISGPPQGFKLLARSRHVVTEAARVEDSVEDIESNRGRRFGYLINESFTSCRDNYEISHPAINDLVAIAIEAGSVGSRLTGAGFGGCTVNLVPDEKLEEFLDEVETRYFEDALKSYPDAYLRYMEKIAPALLTLKPSGGAQVLF
ncbi:MAG: hypothetical protein U9N45_04935, partial [Gemmatimonadota bacterium]|nr:hypothetical protein [Gemmatimonadota bacterium]